MLDIGRLTRSRHLVRSEVMSAHGDVDGPSPGGFRALFAVANGFRTGRVGFKFRLTCWRSSVRPGPGSEARAIAMGRRLIRQGHSRIPWTGAPRLVLELAMLEIWIGLAAWTWLWVGLRAALIPCFAVRRPRWLPVPRTPVPMGRRDVSLGEFTSERMTWRPRTGPGSPAGGRRLVIAGAVLSPHLRGGF